MILTPDQRLRVFVSSTLGELAEEREAVQRAIESLHLTPVMFEMGARPHPPRSLYRSYLEQSHVFIGMYWQRYGWVAPDMEISGLEDEYELSEGMPRLVYFKSPAPEMEPGLKELANRIRDEGGMSYAKFSTPDELAELVAQDLITMLSERFEGPTEPAPAEERTQGRRRSGVPAAPTPLIGRQRELETLARLLTQEGRRLITLCGPGGVGKTRLAMEAAERLGDHFPGGVFFVPLAAVDDPGQVPAAVMRTLGLSAAGGIGPGGALGEDEMLRDYFRDRRALLVLDNFEQVSEAATFATDLLTSCPELTVLVTSRAVLRVGGEYDLEVGPLDLPVDGRYDRMSQYDAVRLFIERAKAVRAGFDIDERTAPAVAEICHRLDGLPLAIELAAARVKLLPPEELLARLGDRLELVSGRRLDAPERHQALRSTILWSYELLDEDEKELFARLAVFAGRFTLEAVEAVCDPSGELDVLGALSSLIDKSLVRSDDGGPSPGFAMLRTIKTFAVELLDESAAGADVRSAHARFFVQRAIDAYDGLRGPDEVGVQQELLADIDNQRAAFAWWLENEDPNALADVGWSLWMFWWLSGSYHKEGRALLERVLSRGTDLSTRSAARALAAKGLIAFWQADYAAAVPDLKASLECFHELDDDPGTAYPLAALGLVRLLSPPGDWSEAQIRDAHGMMVAAGDRWGAVLCRNGLLWGLQTSGILAESDEEYVTALGEAEALGSPQEIAMANANLTRYHVYRQEPERALPYLGAWLDGIMRLRHKAALASAVEAGAEAARLLGDHDRAVRLFAAAHGLREAIGATPRATVLERRDRNLRVLEGELGRDAFDGAWAKGAALGLDELVAEARGEAPAAAPAGPR